MLALFTVFMRMNTHACFVYSIYEKLIQFCSIDELGTNYPKVNDCGAFETVCTQCIKKALYK